MDMVPITPNLTMLRVNGWQLYTWHDDDSVTLIDAGAPGSGAESFRLCRASTGSC
jgi:hypothetical protein